MKKLDQATLATLSNLKYPTPNNVVIVDKLLPKEYAKVNAAMEALGGTWSRKAKAHVFPGPAEVLVDQLIMTGEFATARDVGWFPTPAPLARELVDLADLRAGQRVLEPSAGEGALVNAITTTEHGELNDVLVFAVERDPTRRSTLMARAHGGGNWKHVHVSSVEDFMDFEPRYGSGQIKLFDRCVMNPPFARVGRGDHLDHVRHAYELLGQGGVLVSVLPSSVKFRRDRRHAEFRAWVEGRGTIDDLPEGSFAESGTGVNTVVIRLAVA